MAKRSYQAVDRGSYYGSARQKRFKARLALARGPKFIGKYRRAPLRSGGWASRTQELKVVDNFRNDVPAPNGGTVILLNGIGQGTDYYNRIGRKVMLKSLMIKGALTVEQTGTGLAIPNASMSTRLAIVYDSQTNGTLPSYADIFQSVDSNGGVTNTTFSGVNLNNRDRFKILKDWTVELRPNIGQSTVAGVPTIGSMSISAGQHGTKNIKWYKKLNHEMIFGDTDDSIGSIQTGSLLLVLQSDSGLTIANSADPYLDMQCRIRFADP